MGPKKRTAEEADVVEEGAPEPKKTTLDEMNDDIRAIGIPIYDGVSEYFGGPTSKDVLAIGLSDAMMVTEANFPVIEPGGSFNVERHAQTSRVTSVTWRNNPLGPKTTRKVMSAVLATLIGGLCVIMLPTSSLIVHKYSISGKKMHSQAAHCVTVPEEENSAAMTSFVKCINDEVADSAVRAPLLRSFMALLKLSQTKKTAISFSIDGLVADEDLTVKLPKIIKLLEDVSVQSEREFLLTYLQALMTGMPYADFATLTDSLPKRFIPAVLAKFTNLPLNPGTLQLVGSKNDKDNLIVKSISDLTGEDEVILSTTRPTPEMAERLTSTSKVLINPKGPVYQVRKVGKNVNFTDMQVKVISGDCLLRIVNNKESKTVAEKVRAESSSSSSSSSGAMMILGD